MNAQGNPKIRRNRLFRTDVISAGEEALVERTCRAVCDAGLHQVASALERRMLGPLPGGPAGMKRVRRLFNEPRGLAPFAELALREVLHAATASGWSTDRRTQHALAAIAGAGF